MTEQIQQFNLLFSYIHIHAFPPLIKRLHMLVLSRRKYSQIKSIPAPSILPD